jgi:D-alanyl-D-alanine carboxypeptidase (penicillin-binding protein 5/6)
MHASGLSRASVLASAIASAMTSVRAGVVAAALACASVIPASAQQALDVKSEMVMLVDQESGTTLFEKNADKPFPAANLTKLMTAAIVFDLIKDGKISLDTEFPISEHAWRTGGAPSRTTTMFAPINSRVKVSDLLMGLIVQAANDGAIALAEGIAGSEPDFAVLMRKKAAELGLTKSEFRNPSGLPDPDQKVTARDMVKLAAYLIETHPDLYKLFAQTEFTFNKIRQQNRNVLLNAGIGADGLIVAGGRDQTSAIVASTVQDGQRLIVALGGAKSDKDRNDEAKKALDWGYRNFETVTVYKAGEVIGSASVFGGAQSSVEVVAQKPVKMLMQRNSRSKLSGKVLYRGPIKAPVEVGQAVGRLVVYRDDQPIHETAVYAKESVGVGTIVQRATDAGWEYVWTRIRRMIGLK